MKPVIRLRCYVLKPSGIGKEMFHSERRGQASGIWRRHSDWSFPGLIVIQEWSGDDQIREGP